MGGFVTDPKTGKSTIEKDPGTSLKPVDLDYTLDWAEWLDEVGDTLASADITLLSDGAGETVANQVDASCFQGPTVVGKKTVFWLRGGRTGEKVAVTIHVVTNSVPPRKDEKTVYVKMKEH
jgi:hypothetical protein